MADTSTDLTIEDVLLENDDFRLAIRGFAFLEDALASVMREGTAPGLARMEGTLLAQAAVAGLPTIRGR